MDRRPELQELLEELLGSRNVYFQPPASVLMRYPAIRYKLSDIQKVSANNFAYMCYNAYEVTYIDRNPDNNVVSKLMSLPMCAFDRYYVTDNLNHYVFRLYF